VLAGEASIAELINLVQQRHPTNKLVPRHPPQGVEVDMPIAGVPEPRIFLGVRSVADWLCDVNAEHVEPAWIPVDLGEETPLFITNLHHSVLHQDLVTGFVKLPDGDDVGRESRQVVDVREGSMFPGFASEEHGPDPFDPSDRAIPEPHRAGDAAVKVGEGSPRPRHVVGGSSVQNPSLRVPVVGVVEGGEHLVLQKVQMAVAVDRRSGR
jgi:hypothetical protein